MRHSVMVAELMAVTISAVFLVKKEKEISR